MTTVPFPLMPGFHWEEIGCSLILHSLWEPQQDSVVQVAHTRLIRSPEAKGNRERSEPRLPQVSSLWTDHCQPQSAGIGLYHVFVCDIFTSHSICITAHWAPSHLHRPLDTLLLLIYSWSDWGGFWSCFSSFCIHLRNPSPFISDPILLGEVAAQIRGENLGQLPGFCPATLSLNCSFQTGWRPTHILMWQCQRDPKCFFFLSSYMHNPLTFVSKNNLLRWCISNC